MNLINLMTIATFFIVPIKGLTQSLPNVDQQDFIAINQVEQKNVSPNFFSDTKVISPGKQFNLLVNFKLAPHWHIYWKNPGSVGMPLTITWNNLPQGVTIGEWTWSAPKIQNQEGIINYVFEDEAFIKIPIILNSEVALGEMTLSGKAEWLACSEDGCHPMNADLAISVKIEANKKPVTINTALFDKAEKTFPTNTFSGSAYFIQNGQNIALKIYPDPKANLDLTSCEFFPESTFFNSEKSILPPNKNSDGSITFMLETLEENVFSEKKIQGVLRTKNNKTFIIQASVKQNADIETPEKITPQVKKETTTVQEINWIPWSKEKQEQLLNEGKTIFIDFTARWCATCQVNKRVFHDADLIKKFVDNNIVTLRADWTKQNPEIAQELAIYKRAAVPFNIFMKKGQNPYILTETFAGASTVINGIEHFISGKSQETFNDTNGATKFSMWGLIGFAFLGGLILNLMPCVFPVLGLKIMHFVGKAQDDRGKIARHGIVFGIGILISFWILAGVLIILRSSGSQLGWGFQLQSPVFVFAMILLMFVFGLSMSGVFEFGVSATSAGSSLTQKSGYAGSFFSGVLAVIIATPCAAPFLAPALGAALTLEPLPSLGIFTCIALGLAFPYVLLSIYPNLLRFLPKPGEWMESFKQFMAFMLYAPAIYFVWVLIGQIEDAYVQRNVMLSLPLIAFSCWIYGRWGNFAKPRKTQLIAKIFALFLFASTCLYVYSLIK